jgi:hypothetical protein
MEVKDLLEKPLKFLRILSQRFSHEYIVLGLSIEYQARASPSVAITNDLAQTLLLPLADATAASKLMMNWRGSDLLLYFGKGIDLYFDVTKVRAGGIDIAGADVARALFATFWYVRGIWFGLVTGAC